MQTYDVYQDMAERTGGCIFVAVVGPVRTGKSTLITKMMEQLVLPHISDENERKRVIDELPQSGGGKTVMTTQPRFIPGQPVNIDVGESLRMDIRMVDCVGFWVEGALGQTEEQLPRMVRTPWFDEEIPFKQAAELGTQKVIKEHTTVALVVTADETVAGIGRSQYIPAEEKAIEELKKSGKPFLVLLNSAKPKNKETRLLAESLCEKYGTSVLPVNAMEFDREDLNTLLSDLLYEFPVRRVDLSVPGWLCALDQGHWLLVKVLGQLEKAAEKMHLMRDFSRVQETFADFPEAKRCALDCLKLGDGVIKIAMELDDALFYKVLGEECGYDIRDECHLFSVMKDLVLAKKQYNRVETALKEVDAKGYGVMPPLMDELQLAKPELVQQGNHHGVRLKANAPSLHLIRVDVETEVSPIIGSKAQSQEFMQLLEKHFAEDPEKGWTTDIFGKTLRETVKDGLMEKACGIPQEGRDKLQEALGRMVNEGGGGMLCILL